MLRPLCLVLVSLVAKGGTLKVENAMFPNHSVAAIKRGNGVSWWRSEITIGQCYYLAAFHEHMWLSLYTGIVARN